MKNNIHANNGTSLRIAANAIGVAIAKATPK